MQQAENESDPNIERDDDDQGFGSFRLGLGLLYEYALPVRLSARARARARVQPASRALRVEAACRWNNGATGAQEGEADDQTKQEKDNKAVILKAKSPDFKSCLYEVYCRLMNRLRDAQDRSSKGAGLTLGE